MQYVCQYCQKNCVGGVGLSHHLRQSHNFTNYEQYWNEHIKPDNFCPECPICGGKRKFISLSHGYFDTCCSLSCRSRYIDSFKTGKSKSLSKKEDINCHICNKQLDGLEGLHKHLFGRMKVKCYETVNPNLTSKQYYIQYLLPESEKENITCPICKKEDKHYRGFLHGFSKTCASKSCIGGYGSSLRPPTPRRQKIYPDPTTCALCNQTFAMQKGLASHLSQMHKNDMSKESYYLKYLVESEDVQYCPFCGKKKKFIDIQKGYTKTCTDDPCVTKQIDASIRKRYSITGCNGYSRLPINTVFNPLIEKYNLDKTRCLHAELNKEFRFYVGNLEEFSSRNIKCISYDFCYLDKDNQTPLVICEFQGICFHIRYEDRWKKRRLVDYYKNPLIKSLRKDILKYKYLKSVYPQCEIVYIWEDNIEEGKKKLENFLSTMGP